jgi:hypothetical protein
MKMIKILSMFVSTAALLLSTTLAFGFGANGHRVVGEIAEKHLTPKAQKALENILDGEPLAFAATWPDEMRSSTDDPKFWSYSAAANWHFVNLKDGETYESSEKNSAGDAYVALNTFIAILEGSPIPEGPVATALTGYLGDLSDPANQKKAKQFAVKFIVHIVGDMHQPLHAGRPSDLGGNRINVWWFGKSSNLHKVWDEGLVDFPGLSFTEIVRKVDRISKSDKEKIQNSQPIDWLNEAIKMRATAYDLSDYKSHKEDKKPLLSYDYIFNFVPVIEQQMLKGGLRTAALFNRIFSKKK